MNLLDLIFLGLLAVSIGFGIHTEILLRRTKRMQDDIRRKLAPR